MWDTAGEVGTNSKVTYSCRPLHVDEQRQDDQLEPTYTSSVPIRNVALKTYRERWTIEKGGGRGSGRSVLVEQDDDDNDDFIKHPSSASSTLTFFLNISSPLDYFVYQFFPYSRILFQYSLPYIYIYIYIYIHTQGSLNKFPDFFRMGTFIDSTHMKL